MRITRLRGSCDPKPTCPTLYRTDQGSVVVQGWVVNDSATMNPPSAEAEGEAIVEVPVALLWDSTVAPCRSPALTPTDRGTVIVRGRVVDDPKVLIGLSLPEGEAAVEVSITLLPEVVLDAQ